jgi:HD superfamily phosphohydrolase
MIDVSDSKQEYGICDDCDLIGNIFKTKVTHLNENIVYYHNYCENCNKNFILWLMSKKKMKLKMFKKSSVEFMKNNTKERYVRDPIYGMIYLPKLAWKIIDTSLFQRSRRIKQLGCVEYVYPTATHSRFSHMIGTAHLAQKVCEKLNIIDKEKMTVVLAGLLHDIGHAPMSHIYEQAGGSHHEERSCLFIDYLAKEIIELKEYSVDIKNIIKGSSKKEFMAEIISNNKTGLDVDKLDYLVRDCYFTGVKCIINVDRIIDGMSLKNNSIVYNKKIIEDITDVFRTRYTLHQRVYQHRVVRTISLMICEIFKLNKFNPETNHEWINFTDDWFTQLRNNDLKTKELFNQIDCRNLWKTEILNFKGESTINFILENGPMDIYTITSGCKGKIPLSNGDIHSIKEHLQNDKTIYLKIKNEF